MHDQPPSGDGFLSHENGMGIAPPVIVLGWTLNYELFFYVVSALTLSLPAGRRLAFSAGNDLVVSNPRWVPAYLHPL